MVKLQIDWGISPFGCYGMNGAKILKWDNLGQIETKFVCKLIVPGVQSGKRSVAVKWRDSMEEE